MLLALADGDLHGYGIRQEVARQTDGAIKLGAGTLYEAIQRLEQTGLIAETDTPEQDDDRPRRFYRLTKQGWTVVRGEVDRLQRLVGLRADQAAPAPDGIRMTRRIGRLPSW